MATPLTLRVTVPPPLLMNHPSQHTVAPGVCMRSGNVFVCPSRPSTVDVRRAQPTFFDVPDGTVTKGNVTRACFIMRVKIGSFFLSLAPDLQTSVVRCARVLRLNTDRKDFYRAAAFSPDHLRCSTTIEKIKIITHTHTYKRIGFCCSSVRHLLTKPVGTENELFNRYRFGSDCNAFVFVFVVVPDFIQTYFLVTDSDKKKNWCSQTNKISKNYFMTYGRKKKKKKSSPVLLSSNATALKFNRTTVFHRRQNEPGKMLNYLRKQN